MTEQADTLHHCRRCRWSVAHSAGNLEPLLWCRLREGIARGMCPGWEREAAPKATTTDMVDDLDRAEIECEYELAEALRQRKPAGPAPTGYCHWCGDAVDNGMRWCNREHEASWEYETERMAQNGRAS